jgi:hypothetical protein
MRTRLLLTGLAAASLVAAGLAAASPAYASSDTAGVSSGSANQYLQFCSSASTCNEQQQNDLYVQFTRTGSTSGALDIFYKIVNGTAVDGTDFNTPATGEVVIPAGQTVYPVGHPLTRHWDRDHPGRQRPDRLRVHLDQRHRPVDDLHRTARIPGLAHPGRMQVQHGRLLHP